MNFEDCRVDLGGALSGYRMSALPGGYKEQMEEAALEILPIAHRILHISMEFVPDIKTTSMITDGEIIISIRKTTPEEKAGYKAEMEDTNYEDPDDV